jgi:hypothetical protein
MERKDEKKKRNTESDGKVGKEGRGRKEREGWKE